MLARLWKAALPIAALLCGAAAAADIDTTPAKDLFGAVTMPAAMSPEVVGSYAKGCVAGAVALPVDGNAWQAMRLSRNRNWGHPNLVAFVERLARDARNLEIAPGGVLGQALGEKPLARSPRIDRASPPQVRDLVSQALIDLLVERVGLDRDHARC